MNDTTNSTCGIAANQVCCYSNMCNLPMDAKPSPEPPPTGCNITITTTTDPVTMTTDPVTMTTPTNSTTEGIIHTHRD